MKMIIRVNLVLLFLLQLACKNSVEEGKKIDDAYCNCIKQGMDTTTYSSIISTRDSCQRKAVEMLASLKEENTTEVSGIDSFYSNAIIKMSATISAALSRSISKVLVTTVWTKEGEANPDNYLFSFASNVIQPLNKQGNLDYLLSGDTIKIDNDKKTKLIARLENDGRLGLSNIEGGPIAYYHPATEREKIIGFWSMPEYSGMVYTFRPNNTFDFQGYYGYRSRGSYSYNGSTFNTSRLLLGTTFTTSDKLEMPDINTIRLPNFLRNENPHLVRSLVNRGLDVKTLYH